jgi:hypothetical protein
LSRERWLRVRVGDKAAEHVTIYEEARRENQAKKRSGRRRTPPACVRLSYEREEEDDDADKRARGGSETRENKGEAASASWAGPMRGGKTRRAAASAGRGTRAGPKGQKPERRGERDFLFLLFLF